MARKTQKQPLSKAQWPEQSPFSTGMACTCPRCGSGRLYAGMLTPAQRCASCGLDYSFIDSGDGPAVFVILILGFVAAGLALIFEMAFSPPLWVHAIIWIPLISFAAIWALRVTKAIMIALQYKTDAQEGRI